MMTKKYIERAKWYFDILPQKRKELYANLKTPYAMDDFEEFVCQNERYRLHIMNSVLKHLPDNLISYFIDDETEDAIGYFCLIIVGEKPKENEVKLWLPGIGITLFITYDFVDDKINDASLSIDSFYVPIPRNKVIEILKTKIDDVVLL
jgi:hypothetical protein